MKEIGNIENVCLPQERPANYHRFYALFNRLPGVDREDMKEILVSSFTDGRTIHLHEMTRKEYDALCTSLEERTGWREQLRKKRSLCLKLMQQAGVDTSDWGRVNDFCRNSRIAGKVFALLGLKDLDALQVKLRAIIGKGGLRSPQSPEPMVLVYGSYGNDGKNGSYEKNEKNVN